MRRNGSDRDALPAILAPIVVLMGVVLMGVGIKLASVVGLRLGLIVAETLLVLPALLSLVAFRIPVKRGLGLVPQPRAAVFLCIALGAALWALSLGLFELQYVAWKPPAWFLDTFQRLHQLLRPSGPLDGLLSLAAIALAPALCEELLFRGVALPALARSLGSAAAIVGSAILFGLIHVDSGNGQDSSFYRVPFASVVGLGLGALRVRTGSVIPPVLAHTTLNTITFLAAPFATPPDGTLPAAEPLLGAGLFLTGCLASIFIVTRRALTPAKPDA